MRVTLNEHDIRHLIGGGSVLLPEGLYVICFFDIAIPEIDNMVSALMRPPDRHGLQKKQGEPFEPGTDCRWHDA